MTHVRKQIRDRAVTVLTGLTTTGANVFPSQVHPFHNSESVFPGLAVYTSSEEIDNKEEDEISHVQERSVLLVVDGFATATAESTIDDTLDQIAEEVETAIFNDQFFNGLAHGTNLVGSDAGLSDAAEKIVGAITMVFQVTYLTDEGVPGTAL